MYTDEDLQPVGKERRRSRIIVIFMLPLLAALFLMDGKALLEQTVSRFGVMSDSLMWSMVEEIEYNYYYDDIFNTESYKRLRNDLTQTPIKTFSAFEEYVYGLSELAGDEFSYFYYDSVTDGRTDYSEVNASDYEDDFSTFSQEGIPVIRFKSFAYDTGTRVVDALDELHKAGDSVVVLDLTDNTGGMIDQCVLMCDALLPETVIFEEQYNDRSRYQYVSDPKMMNFEKIVILLNEGSASCSEILALTLKEHLKEKVLLVGSETFGKKVTQSVNQDDRLHFSLYLVTAGWSVEGKTTEDLNGYLIPWRHKNLKGFDDSFQEARIIMEREGLLR